MAAREAQGRGGASRARRRTVGTALWLAVLALLGSACEAGTSPSPGPTRTPTGPPSELTFGVFGSQDELAAYTSVTESFNTLYDEAHVDVRSWSDHEALAKSLEHGEVPDVFLVSRDHLARLLEEDLTVPVDTLLDERGVDFGDGYSRDGLQAFSAEDRLQCMPYSISPTVIYYNTELVDFDRMAARGLPVPVEPTVWGFEQFTAAAEFATRPRLGTRGVYVEPSLQALAPFIYSGGGELFDDEVAPTSLAFSDDATRDALERSLELLRSPHLTLTPEQLEQRSALAWFKRGKLAMIEGTRRLVPELRRIQGLEFDVIPMPVLEQSATVGEVTGLCLSAEADDRPAAADFMVHMLSTPSVQRVARTGYMVPANLEVALADEFLQPGRLPAHAQVFNNSVRAIVFPPLLTTWAELEEAVARSLYQLINVQVLDLDLLTERIDEESRTVLDPEGASPSG